MTRRRLLAAAVGAGVVLAALPAVADVEAGRTGRSAAEAEALGLLTRAADAGRRLSYRGTQYVASWREDSAATSLVEMQHDPERGSVITDGGPTGDAGAAPVALLDLRMVDHLAAGFSLEVAGPGRCTGRDASVVEARRADGSLAGRFWVDRATGMLLRREVFDDDGQRVRSSAFVDLDVTGTSAAAPPGAAALGAEPRRPRTTGLRRDGWHVPERLPAGFRLFDTEMRGEVLQLAYTDGLSTLSLFAQDGRLGTEPMRGFTREEVDGRAVWVRGSSPERVVWAGGDRVWTLVSDAPQDAVRAAVAALPRGPEPDDGVGARLGRGLSRLAGMLNPFD